MIQQEALQWLIDNGVEYLLMNIEGVFCFKVTVEDPNGGEDHYCAFRLEPDFIQQFLAPTAQALRKSIDG